MAVGLAILNAEKDANARESAAKKVEEAAETAKKTNQPRIQKKQINRMKCFLGSKHKSRSMPAMVFSVCRMLGYDNILIIYLRRRW